MELHRQRCCKCSTPIDGDSFSFGPFELLSDGDNFLAETNQHYSWVEVDPSKGAAEDVEFVNASDVLAAVSPQRQQRRHTCRSAGGELNGIAGVGASARPS